MKVSEVKEQIFFGAPKAVQEMGSDFDIFLNGEFLYDYDTMDYYNCGIDSIIEMKEQDYKRITEKLITKI